jgi:hypothetical protein
MPTKQKDYLVTDASIYTVHPVVTEHRVRVIEEVEPFSDSEKVWGKIIAWVFIIFCFVVIGNLLGCH